MESECGDEFPSSHDSRNCSWSPVKSSPPMLQFTVVNFVMFSASFFQIQLIERRWGLDRRVKSIHTN